MPATFTARLAARLSLGASFAAALSTLAAAPGTAFAALDADVFAIDRTVTGRLVPQHRLVSAVPINRRWEQMSPQYQAVVRDLYENLAPDDEPPFPRDGLRRIFTEYERVQQRAQVEGEVLLTVTVDAQGQPREVKVYKTPHADVAKAAAFLLMQETYKPGKCHGQPCTMDYLFDVNLEVDHDVHQGSIPGSHVLGNTAY